jgi:SpoVK/Ycf46/Vps4 family AAA+-type ATPase
MLARDTNGFSGADLKALCSDAAFMPIRALGLEAMATIGKNDVPPITYKHFKKALKGRKPSVAPEDLKQYEDWNKLYGTINGIDDESDEEAD